MSEHLRADVLVVGGGPAGMAAATTAAESGAAVLLVDEGRGPGGQIWRGAQDRGNAKAAAWMARMRGSAVRLESGLDVVQQTGPGEFLGERDGRRVVVTAKAAILATGAREAFLPFPGWTLPGVLGVGGAQALMKSGGSFRGLRVVVAGTGPLLLPVAASLAKGGARIACVAEQAPLSAVAGFAASLWRRPGKLLQAARYRGSFLGTRYRTGVWTTVALGSGYVSAVRLTDGTRTWTEECDVLACAYGLVPNVELPSSAGCYMSRGFVRVDAACRSSVEGVWVAGEPTGIGGVDRSLLEGEIAGLSSTGRPLRDALVHRHRVENTFAARVAEAFALRPELRDLAAPDTIVCRCEDVPLGRIQPHWTRRQAKLYTRAGMGACQGRICGFGLDVLRGVDSDTARPPARPVRVATLGPP